MAEVLILLAYPNYDHSYANRAWTDAVNSPPRMDLVHLDERILTAALMPAPKWCGFWRPGASPCSSRSNGI